MRIGITEILVILVIVRVVLGQSIRDFKKEVKADDEPARKEEDKGGDAQ